MSIPARYLPPCPGSGKLVTKADCWNKLSKTAPWTPNSYRSNEGWRTKCPDCGKDSAVGPSSHAIQKHSLKPPKLTKDERLTLLYEDTYEKIKAGMALRPSPSWPKVDIDTWLMAFLDGCGDSEADGRKIGALKRWMKANGMSSYTMALDKS